MLRILKLSLLVSVVVLLNAMTTLLFVQNAVPASAGPQCVTGDVNDDAAVDLGDPVYLLSYLFQGGPEPVACAQDPAEVIVLNSPDVNVVNEPTVRVVGHLNPDNAISLFVDASGFANHLVFEIQIGFKFYLQQIVPTQISSDVVSISDQNSLRFKFRNGESFSLDVPVVFQEGDSVFLEHGTGSAFLYSLFGYLEPIA